MAAINMLKVVSPRGHVSTMVESAFRDVWEHRGYQLYEAPMKAEAPEKVEETEPSNDAEPVTRSNPGAPSVTSPGFGLRSEQTSPAE